MNLVPSNANQTMSSREIAELTNKEHSHVLRDIRNMLKEIYPDAKPKTMGEEPDLDLLESKGIFIHKQPTGFYSHVDLPKRETLILVSGYSVVLRSKIIDRWQDLEDQQAPKLPQTKLEWMQLAVEQEQELIAKQAVIDDQVEKLALAAPAVLFVERYVESKSSKSLSDVAKVLGVKPRAFIAQLSDDGVIFKRGGSWIAHQQHIDNGRFTVSTGESNGHAFVQTRAEPKGIEWLAKKYGGAK